MARRVRDNGGETLAQRPCVARGSRKLSGISGVKPRIARTAGTGATKGIDGHQRGAAIDPVHARDAKERVGVPITRAEKLRRGLHMDSAQFSRMLGVKPAAYQRMKRARGVFKGDCDGAVSDIEELLATARGFLPADRIAFDVTQWFAEWIKVPQPSLGGRRPEALLGTPDGRVLVRRLIGAMGSGAYL